MTERPAQEKIMLYRRGFGDGSSSRAHRSPDDPSYMRGYNEGQWALGAGLRKLYVELGRDFASDILRGQMEHVVMLDDALDFEQGTNAADVKPLVRGTK